MRQEFNQSARQIPPWLRVYLSTTLAGLILLVPSLKDYERQSDRAAQRLPGAVADRLTCQVTKLEPLAVQQAGHFTFKMTVEAADRVPPEEIQDPEFHWPLATTEFRDTPQRADRVLVLGEPNAPLVAVYNNAQNQLNGPNIVIVELDGQPPPGATYNVWVRTAITAHTELLDGLSTRDVSAIGAVPCQGRISFLPPGIS